MHSGAVGEAGASGYRAHRDGETPGLLSRFSGSTPSGVDDVFVDVMRIVSPLVDCIVAVCIPRALEMDVPQTMCIRRVRLMMDGGAHCSAGVWRCCAVEGR